MSPRGRVAVDPESRYWPKVNKTASCWLWTAHLQTHGYGAFKVGQRMVKAHRFAYELANGPIPEGLLIDHTCHNRACVNPAHLRLATNKQNLENQAGAQRNSKTGVRGVYWNNQSNAYHAAVRHNKESYFLGVFTDLEDAKAAVIAKRNELFTHNDADRRDAA